MRLDLLEGTPWIDLCDVMTEDMASLATTGDYRLSRFYHWLKARPRRVVKARGSRVQQQQRKSYY